MTKPKTDTPTHWSLGPGQFVLFSDLVPSHLLQIERRLREAVAAGKRVAWSQRYLRAVEHEIVRRQSSGAAMARLPVRAPKPVDPADPAPTPNGVFHLTRDGRVLTFGEMTTSHLGALFWSLGQWLKGETDPLLRKELKSHRASAAREIERRTGSSPAKGSQRYGIELISDRPSR